MTWLIALIGTLSLAVIGLTVLTLYRARLDRQRSDARVAALAAAIDNAHWDAALGEPDAEEMPTAPTMSFVAPEVEQPSRTPAFAIAALIIVGAGALLLAGLNGGSRPARHARVAPASSIELVSMRHAVDGQTLIISGLVRNPTASATPTLSAVVSVLDRGGRVVARGESKLDPLVLEPGKETSFRVSVSDAGEAGRYRVAFVNGSQIVPHVDRRGDLARTALANDAHGN